MRLLATRGLAAWIGTALCIFALRAAETTNAAPVLVADADAAAAIDAPALLQRATDTIRSSKTTPADLDPILRQLNDAMSGFRGHHGHDGQPYFAQLQAAEIFMKAWQQSCNKCWK